MRRATFGARGGGVTLYSKGFQPYFQQFSSLNGVNEHSSPTGEVRRGTASTKTSNVVENSSHSLIFVHFFSFCCEEKEKKCTQRKENNAFLTHALSVLTELGNGIISRHCGLDQQSHKPAVSITNTKYSSPTILCITNLYASPLMTLPKQRQLNVAFAERVAGRSSDEGVIPLTRISKLRCRQEILTSPTRGEVAWYTKSEDSLW